MSGLPYLTPRRPRPYFLLFLLALLPALVFGQSAKTLSGYATDAANGEALIGATVAVPALRVGASTNAYGFFSLTLPADAPASVEVVVSYVGYTTEKRTVQPATAGQLSFRLPGAGAELDEVEIVAPTAADAPDVRSTAIS